MQKITVLMPVYNCGTYISEAILSILNQDIEDFQLLIVDDGSTDTTSSVVESFADTRIRLIRVQKNIGIVSALNLGLKNISTLYTARMDADDFSLPNRLKQQLQYLESHEQCGVLGTAITLMGTEKIQSYPETDSRCRVAMLENSPCAHPTVMFRTELVREIGYSSQWPHAEDFALWVALSRKTRFANLPEPLLRYRLHSGQISTVYARSQSVSRAGIIKAYIKSELGIQVSDMDIVAHLTLIGLNEYKKPQEIISWISKIREIEHNMSLIEVADLEHFLTDRLTKLLERKKPDRVFVKINRLISRLMK